MTKILEKIYKILFYWPWTSGNRGEWSLRGDKSSTLKWMGKKPGKTWQSPWIEEMSGEPKKVEKARVHTMEYWRSDSSIKVMLWGSSWVFSSVLISAWICRKLPETKCANQKEKREWFMKITYVQEQYLFSPAGRNPYNSQEIKTSTHKDIA